MTYQDSSDGTNMGGGHTLSAFYDTVSHAEAAVQRLRDLGIPDPQIQLTHGQQAEAASSGTEDMGFFAMLGEMFFPSDDRLAYAEGLNRGGSLLTVSDVANEDYDKVMDILDDEGAVDMDERTASWREEGWSEESSGTADGFAGRTGYDQMGLRSDQESSGAGAGSLGGLGLEAGLTDVSNRGTSAGMQGAPDAGMGDGIEETVEVVEERLRVGKRDASRGSVRVRSYVVEEPFSEKVNLKDERVEIERRPVDRAVTGAETAFEERSIEAEEYGEEAIASKEARVVEEIRLRRFSEEREETVSGTLRHTEVDIEDDRDQTPPSDGVPRP